MSGTFMLICLQKSELASTPEEGVISHARAQNYENKGASCDYFALCTQATTRQSANTALQREADFTLKIGQEGGLAKLHRPRTVDRGTGGLTLLARSRLESFLSPGNGTGLPASRSHRPVGSKGMGSYPRTADWAA